MYSWQRPCGKGWGVSALSRCSRSFQAASAGSGPRRAVQRLVSASPPQQSRLGDGERSACGSPTVLKGLRPSHSSRGRRQSSPPACAGRLQRGGEEGDTDCSIASRPFRSVVAVSARLPGTTSPDGRRNSDSGSRRGRQRHGQRGTQRRAHAARRLRGRPTRKVVNALLQLVYRHPTRRRRERQRQGSSAPHQQARTTCRQPLLGWPGAPGRQAGRQGVGSLGTSQGAGWAEHAQHAGSKATHSSSPCILSNSSRS